MVDALLLAALAQDPIPLHPPFFHPFVRPLGPDRQIVLHFPTWDDNPPETDGRWRVRAGAVAWSDLGLQGCGTAVLGECICVFLGEAE